MNVIAFDQHWGQLEFIAVLRPGVTPADVIEWITTWGPEQGKGWKYGPGTEQPELWGELYELITTNEPGKYSYPDDDTYIGERYRFTDKEGVMHLLFDPPKLWFYFDYDEVPSWVSYGRAEFAPKKCENWKVHQEEYDNGKCPCCHNPSLGGVICSSCNKKYKIGNRYYHK